MVAPLDALLLVEDEDEELEELDEPVPVGAVVTVPVPAVPAWPRRREQELLVEED